MTARPASTLSALRYGEFRLLFSGLVAANLGLWMQEFALGWLVVQLAVRDGNPALAGFYLGLRSLAGAVPALVFGLFAVSTQTAPTGVSCSSSPGSRPRSSRRSSPS